jgi:hypothetical protein
MQTIEFRGSYQYATLDLLESALTNAQTQLEREELGNYITWLECFSRDGSTLHLHAKVPDVIEGPFSYSLLPALGSTATTGSIEARRNGTSCAYFFVEKSR